MDSSRASPKVRRDPPTSISSPQKIAAQTQQSSTLLGDLYKRLTPPSLTSFLRNPFGQSPRSNSAFLPEITNKLPRNAWEREKRQGVNKKGKKRTVWKRYETRGNIAHSQEDKENVPINEDEDDRPIGPSSSPKKVLKKVCLAGGGAPAPKSVQRLAVAASYDRRRSGLPHKLRVLGADVKPRETDEMDDQLSSAKQHDERILSKYEQETDENTAATEQSFIPEGVTPPVFSFAPVEHLQEAQHDEGFSRADTSIASSTQADSEMSDAEPAEQTNLTGGENLPVSPVDPKPVVDRLPLEVLDKAEEHASSDVITHKFTTQQEHSNEDSTLDESEDHSDNSNVDEAAGEAVDVNIDQAEWPTKPNADTINISEKVVQEHLIKIVSDNQIQHAEGGATEDDGECMDFTACLEDPTVVGDQYVGTLELRGLRLPSKSELTDEEASGPEDESPDMLEDDPELFEFLDEKTVRSTRSQQSPIQGYQNNSDVVFTTQSPEDSTSQAPPAEETTTVIVDFNDDENVLTDFISRAKASKAARIAKRTSDTHKRDSDVVKRALASPRKVVEEAETGSPTDKPTPLEVVAKTPKLSVEVNEDMDEQGEHYENSEAKEVTLAGRRSSRRTATPAQRENQTAPQSVSIRRPGAVVLRRTELQELANQTRTNTRRNKGAAIPAKAMLAKLRALAPEAAIDDSTHAIEQRRTVQWNEELVSFFDEGQKNKDLSQATEEKAPEQDSTNTSRSRGRRGTTLPATNVTPGRINSTSVDSEPEQALTAENNSTKEVEPEKKIAKRRQIPKPTSRTVTRTQAAAQVDQANPTVPDTNVVDADGGLATASATKRNALPRTRTSARR